MNTTKKGTAGNSTSRVTKSMHIFAKTELGERCTPSDVAFVPQSSRFVISCRDSVEEKGSLRVYKLNVDETEAKGSSALLRTIETSSIGKCCTFDASPFPERFLAVGEFGGGVSVWDLEAGKVVYQANFHSEIINSIDGCGGGSIEQCGTAQLVTGCRDGSVCVWDLRLQAKPSASFKHPDEDCWSVCFASERFICAGFDTGRIRIWDLRANKLLSEHKELEGICSVAVSNKCSAGSSYLLATTVEDDCFIYDLSSLTQSRDKASHKRPAKQVVNTQQSTVWAGRFSPLDPSVFITAGGNGSINLYATHESTPKSKAAAGGRALPQRVTLQHSLSVTTQPITCLDWHRSKEGLCLFGSFDNCSYVGIVC